MLSQTNLKLDLENLSITQTNAELHFQISKISKIEALIIYYIFYNRIVFYCSINSLYDQLGAKFTQLWHSAGIKIKK